MLRRKEKNLKKKASETKKGWRKWERKTGIRVFGDYLVIAVLTRCGFQIYGKSVWEKGFDKNLKLRKERS